MNEQNYERVDENVFYIENEDGFVEVLCLIGHNQTFINKCIIENRHRIVVPFLYNIKNGAILTNAVKAK